MATFTLFLVFVGILQAAAAALSYGVARKSAKVAQASAVIALAQKRTGDKQLKHLEAGLEIARINAEAAKKSADVAERTLVVTQRAYVQAVNWVFKGLVLNEIPRVEYQIKNVGRTPARILTTAMAAAYQTAPGPAHALTETNEGGVMLGADVVMGKHIDVHPALTQIMLDGLESGQILWRVWVRVSYVTFDDTKIMQTCMRYSHQRKVLVLDPQAGYEQSD